MESEYIREEYIPDSFSKVYWNTIQALLWIYYGAEGTDNIRETDDSLYEEVTQEDVPFALFYFLNEGKNGFALEETEEVLLYALQEGKIKGYGVPNGEGIHEEIPVTAWASLQLFPDESMAGSLKLSDVITWHDLKFKRVDIMDTWNTEDIPESRENVNLWTRTYRIDREKGATYEISNADSNTNNSTNPHNQKKRAKPKDRKNKFIPRDALGRLMLNLAKAFANKNDGAVINGQEMLTLLNKKGTTIRKSDQEYVLYSDLVLKKVIPLSKNAFERRLTRIRKHITEIYPT